MTRACAWGGCSRAFESNATRDAKKLGLMPFEIARKGHRITAPWEECGDAILASHYNTMSLIVGLIMIDLTHSTL